MHCRRGPREVPSLARLGVRGLARGLRVFPARRPVAEQLLAEGARWDGVLALGSAYGDVLLPALGRKVEELRAA